MEGPGVTAIFWFMGSAVLVDLIGYWLHRWAHRPTSPLYRAHMTHHLVNYPPRKAVGEGKYVSAGSDSLAIWFAPFGIVYAAVVLLLNLPHPAAILLGGAAVALVSSLLHDAVHISGSYVWRWRPLLGVAVRHHTHHFKMGRNFGICTDIWDRLFRTRRGGSSSRQGSRARNR